MRSEARGRLRRCPLITGSVLLTLVLGVLVGCVGLPANVANCKVTPTPPSNTSIRTYTVDTYYTAQPNWYQEEIDIAFQVDGNYAQQPYNVWLDEVNLFAN